MKLLLIKNSFCIYIIDILKLNMVLNIEIIYLLKNKKLYKISRFIVRLSFYIYNRVFF